jgi:hypothetical protein
MQDLDEDDGDVEEVLKNRMRTGIDSRGYSRAEPCVNVISFLSHSM